MPQKSGGFYGQNKLDEAFEAVENAYIHTKAFDKYLEEIREKGEMRYTAPFVNLTKDISDGITAETNCRAYSAH